EWILSPAASTAMCSTTRIRRRTTAFFRCGTVPPMTGESRDLDLRTRAPARVGDLRGAVFGSRQALRFELQARLPAARRPTTELRRRTRRVEELDDLHIDPFEERDLLRAPPP